MDTPVTYLLDTNAISDLMKAAPRIENWMAGLNQGDRVVTCTIIRGEVLLVRHWSAATTISKVSMACRSLPGVALRYRFARHTSEETTTRSFESGSPDASAFVGSNPGGRPSDSIRRAGVIQERLAKALWANGVGSPYGELVELFPGHSKRPDARTYCFR